MVAARHAMAIIVDIGTNVVFGVRGVTRTKISRRTIVTRIKILSVMISTSNCPMSSILTALVSEFFTECLQFSPGVILVR
jgi:hypothetical protein